MQRLALGILANARFMDGLPAVRLIISSPYNKEKNGTARPSLPEMNSFHYQFRRRGSSTEIKDLWGSAKDLTTDTSFKSRRPWNSIRMLNIET